MLNYYGVDFLVQLQAYYGSRMRIATERGFDAKSSRYYWLYTELDLRLKVLRQSVLFLDALPKFMHQATEDEIYSYVIEYSSSFFSEAAIGSIPHDESSEHPYFNNQNLYWNQLQEVADHFEVGYNTKLLPLTFIDLSEYVVRSIRLYFQIREGQFRPIDRGKFDRVMELRTALPPGS